MTTYEDVLSAARVNCQTLEEFFRDSYKLYGGMIYGVSVDTALKEFRTWGSVTPWIIKGVHETERIHPLPLFRN